VKSESAELLELAALSVAGDDIKQPVIADDPRIDLTLSSCEYVPAGEFKYWPLCTK